MTCAGCGNEIPDGISYFALFYKSEPHGEAQDHGELRIVGGCKHHPVRDIETARAVFGSGGCLLDFLASCLETEAGS